MQGKNANSSGPEKKKIKCPDQKSCRKRLLEGPPGWPQAQGPITLPPILGTGHRAPPQQPGEPWRAGALAGASHAHLGFSWWQGAGETREGAPTTAMPLGRATASPASPAPRRPAGGRAGRDAAGAVSGRILGAVWPFE